MMQTPGPGDRQQVFGDFPGMDMGGGRMAQRLPAPPQSWGLENPTLPSQLTGWLRNYYGGVGSLDEAMLAGLVQTARQGTDKWNAANGDMGHGNAGLPDGGANLPANQMDLGEVLSGMGDGASRYGGGGPADLSEATPPSWLGGLPQKGPYDQTWGRTVGVVR